MQEQLRKFEEWQKKMDKMQSPFGASLHQQCNNTPADNDVRDLFISNSQLIDFKVRPLFFNAFIFPDIIGRDMQDSKMICKLRSLFISISQNIKMNPDDPLLYAARGNIYYQVGEFDKAIADFEKAAELKHPNPWKMQINIERCKTYLGSPTDILDVIEKHNTNESAEMYRIRAKVLFEKGDYIEAAKSFHQLYRKTNVSSDLSDYANALYFSGDFEAANEAYSQALKIIDDSIFDLWKAQAFLSDKSKKSKSITYFGQPIPESWDEMVSSLTKPSNRNVLTQFGEPILGLWKARTYLSLQDNENALSACQAIDTEVLHQSYLLINLRYPEINSIILICKDYLDTSIFPTSMQLKNAGSTAFDNMKYQDAATLYLAAVILEPDNAILAYNVALSYMELGYILDAKRWFTHYLFLSDEADDVEEVNEIIMKPLTGSGYDVKVLNGLDNDE